MMLPRIAATAAYVLSLACFSPVSAQVIGPGHVIGNGTGSAAAPTDTPIGSVLNQSGSSIGLTPNLPVIGGPSGGFSQGARSGNTNTYPTVDTTPVSGQCAVFDSFGGFGSVACSPSGSGTVGNGSAGNLAGYLTTGTSVAGINQAYVAPQSIFGYLSTSQINDVTSGACTLDLSSTINTAIGSNPGRWYFPPGTYCVSSPLIINTKQWFVGAGRDVTVIKAKGGAATAVIQSANYGSLLGTNSASGPYNFALMHMTIDGNKAAVTSGSADGVDIYGYGFRVEHLAIRNASNNGWFSQWSTNAGVPVSAGGDGMDAHLYDFSSYSNATNGVVWQGPHDTVWTDTLTFINGSGGFLCESSSTYACSGQMQGLNSYGNNGFGLLIDGTSQSALIWGTNIESGANLGANGIGIYIAGATAQLIASTVTTYLNAQAGIDFDPTSGTGSSLNGVQSTQNTGAGIVLSGNGDAMTGFVSMGNGTYGVIANGSSNTVTGGISSGNTSGSYSIGAGNHFVNNN